MTRSSVSNWVASEGGGWVQPEEANDWRAIGWINCAGMETDRLNFNWIPTLMAAIQDQAYVTLCAQLASVLGISLASARRQVDQRAAQEGTRDPEKRRSLAAQMLDSARSDHADGNKRLDALLSSSDGDANFLLED